MWYINQQSRIQTQEQTGLNHRLLIAVYFVGYKIVVFDCDHESSFNNTLKIII
jgi:hypothetical protein